MAATGAARIRRMRLPRLSLDIEDLGPDVDEVDARGDGGDRRAE